MNKQSLDRAWENFKKMPADVGLDGLVIAGYTQAIDDVREWAKQYGQGIEDNITPTMLLDKLDTLSKEVKE